MNTTKEIVREFLDYDPDSGEFTWKDRGRKWFSSDRSYKYFKTRFAGKSAGYMAYNGYGYSYIKIYILGQGYLAHRLAWLWMTDEPLPEQIDHKDRNATNNRWNNLRASSAKMNSMNMSMSPLNTSGVTGATWDKRKLRWRAKINVAGKFKHIGRFKSLDDARDAVDAAREKYGYSRDHGKQVAHYR